MKGGKEERQALFAFLTIAPQRATLRPPRASAGPLRHTPNT
jgi:hypothetical protein